MEFISYKPIETSAAADAVDAGGCGATTTCSYDPGLTTPLVGLSVGSSSSSCSIPYGV